MLLRAVGAAGIATARVGATGRVADTDLVRTATACFAGRPDAFAADFTRVVLTGRDRVGFATCALSLTELWLPVMADVFCFDREPLPVGAAIAFTFGR